MKVAKRPKPHLKSKHLIQGGNGKPTKGREGLGPSARVPIFTVAVEDEC